MLHSCIADNLQVLLNMQDKFAEEPETWYIRRANHLGDFLYVFAPPQLTLPCMLFA